MRVHIDHCQRTVRCIAQLRRSERSRLRPYSAASITSTLGRDFRYTQVTTLGPGGAVNAAPLSSFIALSPKPPLVGFIVGGWEGRRKDTLANVEREGDFVANTVTEAMAEAVRACAAELPAGESEVARAGLATRPSALVAPPRLADSPIALECRLERIVPLGDAPESLVIGRIVRAHVADALWRDEGIHREAWHPLGRQGGGEFWPAQRRIGSVKA